MSELHDLKKQRDAIIARLDVTRTRYRAEMMINRRLAATGHHEDENLRFAHDVPSEVFPRSMTFKLLTRHPYAAAVAIAAFALLGPRTAVRAAGSSVIQFAPTLLANSKYGPLIARAMPYIKAIMARVDAHKQQRQQARAQQASVRQGAGTAYQTRNYAHAGGDRHDHALHREHLQTTPTIH